MGGVEVKLHAFLTLALDGGKLSVSCTNQFTPKKTFPGTDWKDGEVGWTGMEMVAERIQHKQEQRSCILSRVETYYTEGQTQKKHGQHI
jgi:hypothetical protein